MAEPAGSGLDVAITGLAARFAGAASAAAFWDGLARGVEFVRDLSREELLAAGVPAAEIDQPAYVRRRGALEGVDLFAASFFGYTPREAETMDPQHRLFLECASEALEDAACDPARTEGLIGVFGAAGTNTYRLNVERHAEPARTTGIIQADIGTEVDYLATRVSYKLGLHGPSLSVQTACSSALVAVHLACQSLAHGECDLALAGGVAIQVPTTGYLYREGAITSPDGRCRAFDAAAGGTVGGDGVGVVALKRLADAVADGDHVYAVVKGSAVNNDGAGKVGFTAPGIQGQAEVIAEAQALAGVEARTIGYVEAHGTGTALGDPIEVRALTRAFAAGTGDRGFCALGSVKTNVGHLDVAAGIAGLIKAALVLHHRRIPPTLHFRAPNPACELEASPFFVNASPLRWPSPGHPRRAGVSSFGIGGTNAHVVLEEAPPPPPAAGGRPGELVLLSARTATALDRMTAGLGAHLAAHPEDDLADVAHTLRVGRQQFDRRRALVCADREEALAALADPGGAAFLNALQAGRDRPVLFLFPGQGAQHAGMGEGLYRDEPVYRWWVDRCCSLLEPALGRDLRTVLYPPAGTDPAALEPTWLAQPALFVTSYALARTWMAWGVTPAAMLGHSLGEYVAACVADVLSLEHALGLVAARGRLMQSVPPGAMLSVGLTAEAVMARLPAGVDLAAVNAPAQCVVSGPEPAIEELQRGLAADGIAGRRLRTSHAFHSWMQDPVVEPLVEAARGVALSAPRLPYVSSLTGEFVTAAEATDPAYWGRQLRHPVRFRRGLGAALDQEESWVVLEVGPGTSLGSLARLHERASGHAIVASMRRPADPGSDRMALLAALARMWLAGVPVDWGAYDAGERRRRLSLPAYPFERQRYWAGRPAAEAEAEGGAAAYERPDGLRPYVAPEGPLQSRVAAIWGDALGIDRVSAADEFFELGGNSLVAVQVLARLQEVFGVDLPPRFLAGHANVAGVAARIGELLEARARRSAAEPRDQVDHRRDDHRAEQV